MSQLSSFKIGCCQKGLCLLPPPHSHQKIWGTLLSSEPTQQHPNGTSHAPSALSPRVVGELQQLTGMGDGNTTLLA